MKKYRRKRQYWGEVIKDKADVRTVLKNVEPSCRKNRSCPQILGSVYFRAAVPNPEMAEGQRRHFTVGGENK